MAARFLVACFAIAAFAFLSEGEGRSSGEYTMRDTIV